MRNTVFGILLIFLSFAHGVEARKYHDTLSLTCKQARSLLKKADTLIMQTGDFIFNRYYADDGFQTAYVQTKDQKHCPLGYLRDSTRMSGENVFIRAALRSCQIEGETYLINDREVENTPGTRPIYSVCRNGQRVRMDNSRQFVGKGSGTSVIGTSFRGKN